MLINMNLICMNDEKYKTKAEIFYTAGFANPFMLPFHGWIYFFKGRLSSNSSKEGDVKKA